MTENTISNKAKIHNKGNKNPMKINKIPLSIPRCAFVVAFMIRHPLNVVKEIIIYKYCDSEVQQ